MRFISPIIFFFVIMLSCKTDTKNAVDVSHIKVNFSIRRFDIDFNKTTKKTLQQTKKKYPLLFPKNIPDSVWINKINNKDEQKLFTETQKVFNNFSEEKRQITSVFKHIKYYNPKFKPPNVITLLSDIDYQNRVIYADSLLLISLDVYLGENHPFYAYFPKYIKQNNNKKHSIVDISNAIIKKQVFPNNDLTFLGKMIYEGKKMYLLDIYLPRFSDREKIGYTQTKLHWAKHNEQEIWKYFIENNLLYSTDLKLNKRFLDISPFSKFYMAQDNLSPGRIGVWIGWQIVRSYMQHNHVSLSYLLETNTEEIFKKSKYKPKK